MFLDIVTWRVPVVVLVAFRLWVMKKTGLGRQREYMNAAAVHMQNVEGLSERIAAAVEGKQQTND